MQLDNNGCRVVTSLLTQTYCCAGEYGIVKQQSRRRCRCLGCVSTCLWFVNLTVGVDHSQFQYTGYNFTIFNFLYYLLLFRAHSTESLHFVSVQLAGSSLGCWSVLLCHKTNDAAACCCCNRTLTLRVVLFRDTGNECTSRSRSLNNIVLW